MPANPTSLRVTDAYRIRLAAIVGRAERDARSRWPTIEDFDQGAEAWRERTALAVTGGQAEAIRATAGYLGAYLTTETGQRLSPPALAAKGGKSRDGRPLSESYRSPIIGTLAALKEGKEPSEALSIGLNRAVRMVETDLMHAARESLLEGMDAHPRIEGWQRAVRGTCGACLGDIAVEVSVNLPSVPLEVHPNCQCVTEPVVKQDDEFGRAAKVGDRAQVVAGREFKNGEWQLAEGPFRGPIVRANDTTAMLNAGTKQRPRWITVDRSGLQPIARKVTTAEADTVDVGALPKLEPTLKGQALRDSLDQPKGLFSTLERGAIRDYTGARNLNIAEQLNRLLRKGSSGQRWAAVRDGLDAAFRRVKPLDESALVFRGAKPKFLERLDVGSVIDDKGFISTSPSRSVAERFTKFDGALLEVVLPRGAKVLDINEAAGSAYGVERELLLPRGTRMVVESVRDDPKRAGRKIFRVRALL